MEKLTVYRGKTDKYGNLNKVAHGAVEGVIEFGPGRSTTRFNVKNDDKIHGESAGFVCNLYIKKGADVRQRDRIVRANGEQYAVVGHALWNENHPFDNFDFGYQIFQMEALNG